MQIYLAVTPAETQEAGTYRKTLAHVAYRIGSDSTLLRQNLLMQTRGGLLSLSDRNAPTIEKPEVLCTAVSRECSRRGYTGVLLDFEERPTPDRLRFVKQLGQQLSSGRGKLFLPESYGEATANGIILICTAISGGNYSERLREAAGHWGGAKRLALDVARLRMDFRLPARSGQGEPLTRESLLQQMEQLSPSVFFSQDLCARYFTHTQQGETHFILFDDAQTMAKKVQIGASLGISSAFFMWPEIKDIAKELFSQI